MHKVVDVSTAALYAAKAFDPAFEFEAEIRILKSLSHVGSSRFCEIPPYLPSGQEHILQYVGFSDELSSLVTSYMPYGNLAENKYISELTSGLTSSV